MSNFQIRITIMFFNELVRTVADIAVSAFTPPQLSDRLDKETLITSKLDRNAGGSWVDIPGHTTEEDHMRNPIKLSK